MDEDICRDEEGGRSGYAEKPEREAGKGLSEDGGEDSASLLPPAPVFVQPMYLHDNHTLSGISGYQRSKSGLSFSQHNKQN